ncbi:hypothetical protein SAMN03159507_01796 [Pseudomonas sp. NFACC32-1]|jgi:hypothetical protein|uniref:hypothetical protein n=1 Tax=Pseudomonas TaxID=286 RepID=UPI0008773E2F|nr:MULTISPECIES: hypothetical protein [Pseudomonas]MDB6442985.1 hypothetical protein [Pseudomonas sp. 21TX0197]MDT8907235.1 hypothetical protein [Pseudomonas prosekii]ROO38315.1 hypothetical protein BIV09_14915 [Pseudomonas sp. 7SR1]ROO41044.1 hypothetical protein BIV08_14865 [Pseudomonas sp. AF76]SCX55824.1 hypothetical protein SAMN03159507_01796 [Pseudomonas sp. NFACC32-1]
MNQLNDYTSLTEPLNVKIMELAPKEKRDGKKTTLFFTSDTEFDSKPLTLTTGSYPFTPIGSLGITKVDSLGQEWRHVLNQITNRHGLTSDYNNPHRADQLVLLDTLDAVKIKEAVARDKQFTKGSYYHPDVEQVFGTTNPVSTFAAQQVIERRAALFQPVPDPTALNYWNLLGMDPAAQAKVYNWLQAYGGISHKFSVHDRKSGDRIQNHFQNLENSKAIHFASETRGEYAAAKLLITVLGNEYQMKIGKASSGRNNGIDQIWVKRNLLSGVVEEYIIVECKGSVDASLNEAQYGWQMSPCWVFYCLIGLLGTNGNLASTSTTDVFAKTTMVRKILDALINPGPPVVKGLVIQPMTKSVTVPNSIEMVDLGEYDLVEQYTNAVAGHTRFHNAPVFSGALF